MTIVPTPSSAYGRAYSTNRSVVAPYERVAHAEDRGGDLAGVAASCAQWPRSTSSLCRASAGERATTLDSSAYWAARRNVLRRREPHRRVRRPITSLEDEAVRVLA
jgi:hypothetical protein